MIRCDVIGGQFFLDLKRWLAVKKILKRKDMHRTQLFLSWGALRSDIFQVKRTFLRNALIQDNKGLAASGGTNQRANHRLGV